MKKFLWGFLGGDIKPPEEKYKFRIVEETTRTGSYFSIEQDYGYGFEDWMPGRFKSIEETKDYLNKHIEQEKDNEVIETIIHKV